MSETVFTKRDDISNELDPYHREHLRAIWDFAWELYSGDLRYVGYDTTWASEHFTWVYYVGTAHHKDPLKVSYNMAYTWLRNKEAEAKRIQAENQAKFKEMYGVDLAELNRQTQLMRGMINVSMESIEGSQNHILDILTTLADRVENLENPPKAIPPKDQTQQPKSETVKPKNKKG